MPQASDSLPLTDALQHLFDDCPGGSLRISEILARMGARGFGFAYIVFGMLAAALPAMLCSLMSLPILLFSLQQMAGHGRPGMPARFDGRTFSANAIRNGLRKAQPWLNGIERFSKPRWPALTTATAERTAAAVCFVLAVVILIPGPFTNTPPGMVIALFGFAMAGRDGLLMLLALLATVVALLISLSALSAFALLLLAWARPYFA